MYRSDFVLEVLSWVILLLFLCFSYQFGWLTYLLRLSCNKFHHNTFLDRNRHYCIGVDYTIVVLNLLIESEISMPQPENIIFGCFVDFIVLTIIIVIYDILHQHLLFCNNSYNDSFLIQVHFDHLPLHVVIL